MGLRPYTEDDLALTVALESDPRVMGHLGGPTDERDAGRLHDERIAAMAAGDLFYVILPGDSDGDGPAGLIAVWRSAWAGTEVHEIGVMLLPQHQAQGLAARAIDEIVPYARERGIGRLHGFAAVRNTASNTVAARTDFHRIEDCDMDYHGRPLRCAHWIRDL